VLELRPARLDDQDALALVDEVQAYYVEIYGAPDPEPLDPAQHVPPHGGFLIGYEDDVPMAMGGWSAVGDGDAKIRRMYVRPAGRRRGWAGRLLDALEDDARATGATRAVLITGPPQREAIAFYRARGYHDIEPFGFYADTRGAVFLANPL
jgi:ribosomal protein S18 acetylase RimI-like enzyme